MDIFDGFVDNPKLYLTAMRCMFAYSTPLFILAIYVIMTASHSTSSSLYRWFPMYQVCLNYISDMIMGPGGAPIIYLPLMGGFPNGVVKSLGIPTVVVIGVAYVVYYYKASSIAVLFYIRFDAILPRHYPFKPNRTSVFILFGVLHMILTVLTPLVLYYVVPDQAAAKKKVLEEFPSAPPSVCLPETIFLEAPFGASTMLISVVFFLPSTVIIFISTYCISHSFYYLHQQKYALSSKTVSIQRAILRATIAEVCCSLMVLVIPAAAFFSCLLASYCHQDLVNTSIFFLAMHGTWGTITILCVYKKYRQRILSMLSGFIITTKCGERDASTPTPSKVGWTNPAHQ